jgi:hypothetical protein
LKSRGVRMLVGKGQILPGTNVVLYVRTALEFSAL